ncbi:MAG: hypothetical protein PHG00_13180 [Methylococcales bacterium]|nr:hypothetical protein [Methylococcales bacterium]
MPYFQGEPDRPLGIFVRLYSALPADLGMDLQSLGLLGSASIHIQEVEADEMWSFVVKKKK